MPTVVVPVGLDMGAIFAEHGPPDRSPAWYEVHLGGQPQQLTAQQYTAWLGAFHDVAAHGELAVDRTVLERHLSTDPTGPAGPLPAPGPIIDDLLKRKLLLEYDTEDVRKDAFGILRLLPRAHGLGSTPDTPHRYRIGDPDRVLAEVDSVAYQVWSLSLTYPALWYSFEEIAEAGDWQLAPGQQPPTPAEVGARVGAALPLLVSSRAAFLDLVNYEPPEFSPTTLDGNADSGHAEPVIVPAGLNMGPGSSAGSWLVHHGMDWVELGPEERAVYLTALDRRDLVAAEELNRQTLADAVRSADGPAEPEPAIADLLSRGLLVEFDPDEGSLERLFRSIQLFPLGRGFGNSADQPGRYWIGVDQAEIGVAAEVYSIWSYALTTPSLWAACAALATGLDEQPAPGEEPMNYTADELAHMIAPVLPALVVSGCAFIDPLNYGQ